MRFARLGLLKIAQPPKVPTQARISCPCEHKRGLLDALTWLRRRSQEFREGDSARTLTTRSGRCRAHDSLARTDQRRPRR